MYKDQTVAVVMPAYNAGKTLRETYCGVIEQGVADVIVVVDDCSKDDTRDVANSLPKQNPRLIYYKHAQNLGYGGNQKSCYRLALEHGADIVVMIHPEVAA